MRAGHRSKDSGTVAGMESPGGRDLVEIVLLVFFLALAAVTVGVLVAPTIFG